ncbi:MAG: alpha-glucosidase C-terminal domain-containing protein, partial [Eubacterium sp.]
LAIVRDGTFEPIDEKNKHVFAFSRSLAVICNLSPKSVTCKVPGILCQADKRLVLSNMKSGALLSEKMKLQPCECSVWELKE